MAAATSSNEEVEGGGRNMEGGDKTESSADIAILMKGDLLDGDGGTVSSGSESTGGELVSECDGGLSPPDQGSPNDEEPPPTLTAPPSITDVRVSPVQNNSTTSQLPNNYQSKTPYVSVHRVISGGRYA